jgi:hypothetical protein
MHITVGQPLWQTVAYLMLLPVGIWLFRAIVVGTLPAAFAFLRNRRLLLLSFFPGALALCVGFGGVAMAIYGIVNRTTITEEYLEIREFQRPAFHQKWADLDEVTQLESSLRLTFLEGGRYKKTAYLSRDKLGEIDYETLIKWLKTGAKVSIRREA